MKALHFRFFSVAAFLLISLFGQEEAKAAAPVYRSAMSFTNSWCRTRALNDAGDILTSDYREYGPDNERMAIIRGTEVIRLTPVIDSSVTRVAVAGMSQRREDGHVFVVGKALGADGYTRPCIWDVAPDGTYTFKVGQMMVSPFGENLDSGAVAVNSNGVMVGGNLRSLALNPARWTPPYNFAEPIALGLPSSAWIVQIDDDGKMLANWVEFGRGTTEHRGVAALVSANGTVTEIPALMSRLALEPPLPPGATMRQYNYAEMRRGDWVVGASFGRAFAWNVGTTNAIELPAWPGTHPPNAWAVTTKGHILGGHFYGPILWRYENGKFVDYDLFRLMPADSFYGQRVETSFMNESDTIVVEFRDTSKFPVETILRVYEPVTNALVTFESLGTSGYEAPPVGSKQTNWVTGSLGFTLRLTRVDYTGPVTATYRTVDGSAKAGVNYVAKEGTVSWAARETGVKNITVPLIDNLEFDHYKTFHVELTSATGALLPEQRASGGLLYEWDPWIQPQNQIYLTNTGWAAPAVGGSREILLKLHRLNMNDGKVILTNFITTDITAQKGVDYLLPEGLSATWEPGQTGVVTLSLPLLPTAPSATNRTFSVTADALVEGSTYRLSQYFVVAILSTESMEVPAFYPSGGVSLVDGKMRIPAIGLRSEPFELLRAPTLDGPWTLEAAASSADGFVTFEVVPRDGQGGEFFQLRQTRRATE